MPFNSDIADLESTMPDHPSTSQPDSKPATAPAADDISLLYLDVTYRDETRSVRYDPFETLAEFAHRCITVWPEIDQTGLKLWIGTRPYQHLFDRIDIKMEALIKQTSVLKLRGRTIAEANADSRNSKETGSMIRSGPGSSGRAAAVPGRVRKNWKELQNESKYKFHDIRPLPYLPNPEKSQRFLERLAADPGIKASMRKHQFSVGLLTEMNPAEHTTHESRTLGLNRNRGEVIELRLRTDRYDGYRDYKVIRKTLCHELSHNVWGEHDRNFWDLTKQIEEEVDRNDWKHGGHTLSNEEFYNPDDMGEGEHIDAGGWTGGEFVLGSSDGAKTDGLTRREILARAAMSRIEKQDESTKKEKGHES